MHLRPSSKKNVLQQNHQYFFNLVFTGSHSVDDNGQKKKRVVREAFGSDVLKTSRDISLAPIAAISAPGARKIRHRQQMKCHFCFQTLGRRYHKHIESCQRYLKLLKNGTTCIICNRSFDSISDAYRHIG